MIQEGERFPQTTFFHMPPASSEVKEVSSTDFLKGKKVVLFGLPGAYTSVCSSKHLPDFITRYAELKNEGADTIVCLSVNGEYLLCSKHRATFRPASYLLPRQRKFNRFTVSPLDPYVMKSWGMENFAEPKVLMISDGDAEFARKSGLCQDLKGLGTRLMRFSMFIDDGVVKLLNVEEPGPMSYKISGPETMLKRLRKLREE
ncbi:thioredoxin-like protein [Paraphysoderma sedebokerense]|nr:thioredoxin-like protein [Paraphysoderma sedebokerense]